MSAETDQAMKSVAKGGLMLIFGSVASKFIMYFYRVFVAQKLGASDYGLLSLGLAVFSVSIVLTNLGVSDGVQRMISDYIGKNEKNRISTVIWSDLTSTVPLSIIGGITIFLLSDFIAGSIFQKPEAAYILKILAMALPFQIIYKSSVIITKAFREIRYLTYIDRFFKNLVVLGVTVILIYRGYGLMGAVIAHFISITLSCIVMIYLVQTRVYPFLKKRTRNIGGERRRLLNYSWPLFFTSIFGVAMNWADTILLGVLSSSKTVGIYNAAHPTAQAIVIISAGFGTVLFPTVSEYYGKKRKDESFDLTSIYLKWVFMLSFPAMLLTLFFAKPILALLFGGEYIGGAATLSILGVASFVHNMSSHTDVYIKSEDRTKIVLYNSIGAAAINIILNLALIPIYGGVGAAIATTVSIIVISGAAVAETYYLFDVRAYSLKKYTPAFLSAILSISLTYFGLLLVYPNIPGLAMIPAALTFGGLYSFFFIILGGLSDEDILLLKEIDKKIDLDLSLFKNIVRKLMRKNRFQSR
jgi:O-antigen/teichoic acid export membrane protein